ncbi:MAG: Holliday junction resolvase RuvX, partial [Muribaculaceae bacterium]
MGRILAIDFGRKRSGIAVTDTLQIVANGLTTVPTHTLIDFLQGYVQREPVELIVVGQPKQLNGQPSESTKWLEPFLNRLRKVMPDMPLVMWDERFTSVIAHRAMIDGGMKKMDRRNKEIVDTIAAAVILNSCKSSVGIFC